MPKPDGAALNVWPQDTHRGYSDGPARPKWPDLDFYEEAAAVDERIAELELDRGDEPPSLELAHLRRWRHVMARLADRGQAQTFSGRGRLPKQRGP